MISNLLIKLESSLTFILVVENSLGSIVNSIELSHRLIFEGATLQIGRGRARVTALLKGGSRETLGARGEFQYQRYPNQVD
jgi:hypothetical protein